MRPQAPAPLAPSAPSLPLARKRSRWLTRGGARRMEDEVADDGCKMSPAACHEFLSRVMYNRRTKGNPLWNSLVLGGVRDGERCATEALTSAPAARRCSHFRRCRVDKQPRWPVSIRQFSGRGGHARQQLHRQHGCHRVWPAFGPADLAEGVEGIDDGGRGEAVAGRVHEGAVLPRRTDDQSGESARSTGPSPHASPRASPRASSRCRTRSHLLPVSGLVQMQISTITAAGCEITEPYELETEWNYAGFVNPGGNSTGSW